MPRDDKDIVINAKQLRQLLKEVVDGVRDGRRYTVLYRSRPAFRIVPVDEAETDAPCPLREDPLFGMGALLASGSGDVAARHDELLYGDEQ
jgi:prevent-host-death family protein